MTFIGQFLARTRTEGCRESVQRRMSEAHISKLGEGPGHTHNFRLGKKGSQALGHSQQTLDLIIKFCYEDKL